MAWYDVGVWSLHFAETEDTHVAISTWDSEHGIIIGEVNCVDFPWQVVDGAEGLIVVAFIEELDLVRPTASSDDQILVFLAELAGIEQAGRVGNLDAIPI